MTIKQFAKALLENLKINPTEEKLFIVELLIKEKKVRRVILQELLRQRNMTPSQIKNLLQFLSKKEVIELTSKEGIDFIQLTNRATQKLTTVEVNAFFRRKI
jgi:DNA-binding MarR family transcriptional regulator